VRYVGGKSKLATGICEAILRRLTDQTVYLEPFLGGGSTFAKVAPHFGTAYGSDVSEDLVLMWNALQDGWEPPTGVDDDLYESLRNAEPSALRGFVGFGCSFGGKWFGGRARGGYQSNGAPRDHSAESARAATRVAKSMKHARICRQDYRDWEPKSGWVVYADPPYAGTQGYSAAGAFDSAEFWSVMGSWAANGALVFVSEYAAPSPWEAVFTKRHIRSLQHGKDGRHPTVETLWALP
jgi:DNA adenine methylase